MGSADQAMELQVFQGQDPHELLLKSLMNKDYIGFKRMASVGLANEPPTIDIDYAFTDLGKTVLGIASTDGLDTFVQLILDFGADPNKVTDSEKRSPLHFAAEAGNSGVLKILLTHSKIEPNLKFDEKTALHLAVSNKEVECVEVLLKHNADPNIADSRGLTPLHVAAMIGHEGIVKLLLSTKKNVRYIDEYGNTALHYATMAKSSEVISLLLEAGSYIGHKNVYGISPITDIDPETISRYLDDCLQTNGNCVYDFAEYNMEFLYEFRNPRADNYEIVFNYRCLHPLGVTKKFTNEESSLEKGAIDNNTTRMEMKPLLHIAKSNSHRHLLKHPILASFLYLKWQRISPILWANFTFYFIFYLLLNFYILSMTYFTDGVQPNGVNTTLNESIDNDTSQSLTTGWNPTNGLWYSTTFALVILVLREMVQLILLPRYYICNLENCLELVLIGFSIALLGGAGASIGALAILVSAWELIILIGQHPRMSTGIEMLKTVTRNFIQFLFLYAFLIIAFALAFYTLFKDGNKSSFPDPGQSLFKTVIMLTGEFDADGIPFVSHPILSHLVFVLFVFLIAIVLLNLLNGLAVSDTTKILSDAELVSLITRTKLVAYAESIFVGSPILKNRWWSRFSGFIQRMKINPLRFLSVNILLFSDVSPTARMLRSNVVLSGDENITIKTFSKLTIDPQIFAHAGEIISRKGHVSDYRKILYG